MRHDAAGIVTGPIHKESLSLAGHPWPGHTETLPPIAHALTHFDWHLQPVRHALPRRLAAATRQRIETELPAGRWFDLKDALEMGLPAPIRKLISAQ